LLVIDKDVLICRYFLEVVNNCNFLYVDQKSGISIVGLSKAGFLWCWLGGIGIGVRGLFIIWIVWLIINLSGWWYWWSWANR
jgi:hypothetical protein